jgi:hypothetical protein
VRVVNLFVRGGPRVSGEVAAAGGPAVRWSVAGRTVTLAGRGFQRHRRVTVRAAGTGVTFRANTRGRVGGPLSLPPTAPRSVVAIARSAGIALPFRIRLPAGAAQPPLPIRAAFYYPWFPQAWSQQGIDPFTHFHPSSGFYSSADEALLRRHVNELLYAGVEAGIVSWFGQGTRSDARVPALLAAAHGTPLRWALYHEGEGHGDPSPAAIRADLVYIRDHYATDPAYLRVGGKPVLFVYGEGADGPAMAARWHEANDVGFYVVLKVFPGYSAAPDQPDAWHQYAPANPQDEQAGQSFSVSPGFWHAAEAQPRLARDLQRFSASVRAMVASRVPWQLVTTFNEWGEGTAVEPASEWATASGYGAYLDALHRDGR